MWAGDEVQTAPLRELGATPLAPLGVNKSFKYSICPLALFLVAHDNIVPLDANEYTQSQCG